MGAYWTIPFFESNVVKISSSNYRWIAPNLRTYTFNKVPKNDRGYKETYILNTTGSLKLNVAKDGSICIENVNDHKTDTYLEKGNLFHFARARMPIHLEYPTKTAIVLVWSIMSARI